METYYELTYWTLARQDGRFIHQHAVDAYEAQHAGGRTRPITAVFGLIGLYLALEKGYTGRQVQLAHMKIASRRKDWPRLEPPARKAGLTVMDVLRAETDAEKETMLMKWAESVWGYLGGPATLGPGDNRKDALLRGYINGRWFRRSWSPEEENTIIVSSLHLLPPYSPSERPGRHASDPCF